MWKLPWPLQNHPPGLHFFSRLKEETRPTQNHYERLQDLPRSIPPVLPHCTKHFPWGPSPPLPTA